MAIINYRIDHVPQIHLPYRVMRYGGLRHTGPETERFLIHTPGG